MFLRHELGGLNNQIALIYRYARSKGTDDLKRKISRRRQVNLIAKFSQTNQRLQFMIPIGALPNHMQC